MMKASPRGAARITIAMKRAFTLIELLVVIAIIAILAAILFPVFAQAKLAAKGTASLSNAKQTNLAAIMYSGDVDDTALLDAAWGSSSGAMVTYGGTAGNFAPWTWLELPYMKSADLFVDPIIQPHSIFLNSRTITNCYFSEYGYNASNLSPWDFSSVGGRTPVSMTAIASPSQTVMFAAKFDYTNDGGFGWYGINSFLPVLHNLEAPSCDAAPGACYFNWGDSGDARKGMRGLRSEGAFTGGVALRKSGQAIVSWTDGHASSNSPGYLAQGTNWTPTIDSSKLVVNDVNKYLWDTTQ